MASTSSTIQPLHTETGAFLIKGAHHRLEPHLQKTVCTATVEVVFIGRIIFIGFSYFEVVAKGGTFKCKIDVNVSYTQGVNNMD